MAKKTLEELQAIANERNNIFGESTLTSGDIAMEEAEASDDVVIITESHTSEFDGNLHVVKRTVSSVKTGYTIEEVIEWDTNNPKIRNGKKVSFPLKSRKRSIVE